MKNNWIKPVLGLAAVAAVQAGVFVAYRLAIDKDKRTVKRMDINLFNTVALTQVATLDFTSDTDKILELKFIEKKTDVDKLLIAPFEYREVAVSIQKYQQSPKNKFNIYIDFYGLDRSGISPQVFLNEFLEQLNLTQYLQDINIQAMTVGFDDYAAKKK